MEYATNIYHYNNLLQEDSVYTFLDGLDDRLDNIRSGVLQMRPFPLSSKLMLMFAKRLSEKQS